MASEIKIHLSTYLKDAGIKATQTQVEKLSRDIQRMNRDTQRETEKTQQALGRLPGVFGKIQKAATGTFGSLLAGIGALKLGIDIGNWLQEKVIAPLLKLKDPIEELKRQNRELEKQAKDAADKWEEALTRWAAGWEKEVAGAERARQKIEDLTQAYLKMQAARERVASAQGDAAMLKMQRDKFDAMASAQTPEEATALGKYHDVLIAEEQMKQGLAKLDREAEASAMKQASAEEQLREATNKRVRMKREMAELDKKIDYMQSQQSVQDLGFDRSIKEEEKLLKRKEALQAQIDAADRDVERRKGEVDAMAASRAAETLERENAKRRAELEIDERKKAYDDYVSYVEEREAVAAADEWNRRQEEMRREAELELRERQRIERELAAQRISELRNELSERQRMESEAQSRQAAAQGALSTAWGWYRNQSQMQAVIDEQKAQAAAEVQWQKDFERLKTWRRDWRTAEFGSLSASDEAVRQVAFAKEEKAAADRAAIETAESVAWIKNHLEAIEAMGD